MWIQLYRSLIKQKYATLEAELDVYRNGIKGQIEKFQDMEVGKDE